MTRLALIVLLVFPVSALAQAPDTLHLGVLHDAALRQDARFTQTAIHRDITDLTLESLSSARRPQVEFTARATFQNEAVSIPFDGGFSIPTPPRDQYEAAAEVSQLLYDGGRIAREQDLQRRRLAEREAEVAGALFPLRMEVNGAFFAALLHQEQRAQLSVLVDDLQARRRLVAAQARDGVALPADAAAIDAELIYVRQRITAAEAARRAALRRLELLAGRSVHEGDVLASPDLAPAADRLLVLLDESGAALIADRPEVERFARARDRAEAEAAGLEAATRPRVSAFARFAVGRPGYDFFDDSIRPYGMIGLRAQWTPFDWGSSAQRADAARRQADIVATEESAFEARLRRDVLDAAYAVERLRAVLASDRHAVALRERVERTALRQLEEGVLVAAEYVQKRNDVFEARLQQRTHRVELAEARARLLTLLGYDIPEAPSDLKEPIVQPIPFTLADPTDQ